MSRLENHVKDLIKKHKGDRYERILVEGDLRKSFNKIAYDILFPLSLVLPFLGLFLIVWRLVPGIGVLLLVSGTLLPFIDTVEKLIYIEDGMEIYDKLTGDEEEGGEQ